MVIAATVAAVSGATVWGLLSRRGAPPVRYSLMVADAGFNTVSYSAISPDSKWIAYSPNRHSGPFPLLLRPLDGFETREVASSVSTGFNPFFSADGRYLAFANGTVLFRVPVTGGTPERLATMLPGVIDGAWGDDNTILLSGNFRADNVVRRALTRLRPDGSFDAISRPAAGEAHQDVHILPGSKTVMFTVATAKSWAIAVAPLPVGGTPRVILDNARRPRYAAGRLLFERASSGDLMAVPFDPDRVSLLGEPARIASVAHVIDSPAFDVSRDGTLIYSGPDDTTAQAGFTAVLVDRSGREATAVAQMGSWSEPRVSPDGRTLILRDIASPSCQLWSVDLQRGTRTRVSFDGDNHNPVWRADGQLTWGSEVEANRTIVLGRIDRPTVSITRLAPGDYERVPESWAPTGELLAFTEIHPERGQDVWLLDTKSGATRPFANSSYKENQARFSRDGRWLAYVSNESGRDEVYLQPVDGDGGRAQVSVDGGNSPLWSPDGKELFYVEKASQLMGVGIDFRLPRPEIGRPQRILQGRYVWDRSGNYDITPDGQRFVFIRRTDESDPSATLRVLINWF
jgi:Tol biopolymer transport system component